MRIEKYKKAGDLCKGDIILTSDREHPQMPVRDLLKSEVPGNVVLVFDEEFAADVPTEALVLMPSTAKIFILQPNIPLQAPESDN